MVLKIHNPRRFLEARRDKAMGKKRFLDFIKKSQREKAFLQACRVQALEKQQQVKEHIKDLLARWAIEEQNELLRKGALHLF